MKKKVVAVFLSLCVAMSLLPTAAMAAPTDGSTVVRIQDTESWYPDATRAFMTKETYWFDQVTAQPAGYVVDESGKTVSISTPEALVWWAKQVNQGISFAGYTVNITDDLDLSAHYWTPICTGEYTETDGKWSVVENQTLDGTTINGNGHTIHGLATATGLRGPNQPSAPGDGSNCYYDAAFIGYSCCDITIEDLTFAGARMAISEPFEDVVYENGSSMVAVIVGAQNNGSLTLRHVAVDDAEVLAMQKAAAFVGNLQGSSTLTVNNCAITNSTFSAYFQVAPIAGYGVHSNQAEINGIRLENNTIQMVDQAWAEYWVDENTGALYYRDTGNPDGPYYLNASTTAVFDDVTQDSQVSEMVMVAEVNGYAYPSLAEAVKAAEDGQTITMLRDETIATTEYPEYNLPQNAILDLNGHTVTVPKMAAIFQGENAIILNGTFDSNADYSLWIGNGTKDTDITIQNVVTETGINVFAANATLENVTATGKTYYAVWADEGANITIVSGTYASESGTALSVFAGKDSSGEEDGVDDHGNITVQGGNVIGKIAQAYEDSDNLVQCISITGGYFTNDPSDYLADGYVAGESDDPAYLYHVVEGSGNNAPAEVVPAAPDVNTGNLAEDEAEVVSQALAGAEAELTAAANAQADKNTVTEEDATQALKNASIETDGQTVTVVIQPYLEISVEDYANNETKELALNITPMYRTVATTANVNDPNSDIKVKCDSGIVDNDANAVKIGGESGILPVTRSVEMSIPLPDGFVTSTSTPVYIQHKGYEYTAKVTSNGEPSLAFTANFTNPHGFSLFTISTTSQAVAKIGDDSYTSLQTAVDAAQPSSTINLLKDGLSATVNKDLTFGNGTDADITVTINGQGITIKVGETYTYDWVYTPPANPNYQIAIGDFANGTVTANPSSAKAGATVTLTATPDEGYAVGTITVTDRFGDAVAVTEQADGTYTFVMPDGQVTVNATFVQTEEPAPAEPFPDVDENDWFYDEVVYVYENGLMNGVENNLFAPNTATNRAMLATILYRLAGEPAVSGDLPFTDVAAGTWYTDAVLWAAQNGIVNGLGENTFAPMNTLTREQLVTMLYRYAEAEGYDVSAAADLSGYPDAGKVQTYAQEAMSWAVAEGIVAGMDDGTLNPAGNATRAQIATILMRFCEDVAQ